PIRNPYAPGAGSPPPDLAGRDELLASAETEMQRAAAGRFAKGVVFHGLRGVGKTVLLNTIRRRAEASGYAVISLEVPQKRSFLSALLPAIRKTLIRLSTLESLRARYGKARKFLNGLINSVKLRYDDVEVAVDLEAGTLDVTGDLETDLGDLLCEVGRAAKSGDTCVVLFIDEIQYIENAQLGTLLAAIHQVTQEQLPILLFAAGLPQITSLSGKARTYAERLLSFQTVGELSERHAREALVAPACAEGVAYDPAALDAIVAETRGYAYFLQEWGRNVWDIAAESPITAAEARAATPISLAQLDESFFKVRFDQLTPAEKRYMRGMAELGEGPHRSGDIAEALGRKVESVAPTRNSLIRKGMLYSPAHGDTAFTVPLFDGFMKRIMPQMP
ncbi:MAG: AAA family ATPase, partial [Pseudomonadota bacterium]